MISEQEFATQASEQNHNLETMMTNIRENFAAQASEQNLDLDAMMTRIRAEVQLELAIKVNPIQALRSRPPETDLPEEMDMSQNETCK